MQSWPKRAKNAEPSPHLWLLTSLHPGCGMIALGGVEGRAKVFIVFERSWKLGSLWFDFQC